MNKIKNFLAKNQIDNYEEMYGKTVYLTIFPEKENGPIYKGLLLGYGVYGDNPEHKTFCVYVERGDGYRFVDYFQDVCFRTKEEFEQYKEDTLKSEENWMSVYRLRSRIKFAESHIPVKVKIEKTIYPVIGIEELPEGYKEPAFVLEVCETKGICWGGTTDDVRGEKIRL